MSGSMLLEPKKPVERLPNTVTIVSMSNKSRIPVCDLYMDVDYFLGDEFGFALSGHDKFVMNSIYSLYEEVFVNICELLSSMNLERGLLVVLSCKEGERQSVASAELLASELKSRRVKTVVHHKGLEKWFKF